VSGAPFRVLVVDDEPLARATLTTLLAADPELERVGACGTVREALAAIAERDPELVLLDIKLARGDGFAVLDAAGAQRRFAVIFVTAYDDRALDAFAAGAIDYLLKPFDDDRFAQAIVRAKERLRQARLSRLAEQLADAVGSFDAPAAPRAPAAPAADPPIAVREAGRVQLVPPSQIDWIEAQDYYAQLHAGGETHLVRQSLRQLEQQLHPDRFVRIHRSAIVNVERVVELRPIAHGEAVVVLRDGTELRLSRSHRHRLHARLGLA
jgi:two-component system LytT family response regulator